MRCSVFRSTEQHAFDKRAEHELIRFKEAMDQAMHESVTFYKNDVKHLGKLFLDVFSMLINHND